MCNFVSNIATCLSTDAIYQQTHTVLCLYHNAAQLMVAMTEYCYKELGNSQPRNNVFQKGRISTGRCLKDSDFATDGHLASKLGTHSNGLLLYNDIENIIHTIPE